MAATAERSCLWNVCMPLLCTGIVMGTKITSWKTHRHQIIQVEALSTFLDAWPCTRSKPGEKGGRCSMSSRGCLKRSKGSINNAQTIDFACLGLMPLSHIASHPQDWVSQKTQRSPSMHGPSYQACSPSSLKGSSKGSRSMLLYILSSVLPA